MEKIVVMDEMEKNLQEHLALLEKDNIVVKELRRPEDLKCLLLLEHKTGYSAWFYYPKTRCESYVYSNQEGTFEQFKKTALSIAGRQLEYGWTL